MADSQQCFRLLRGAVIAVVVCVAMVAFCFNFVDQPVAFFVHDHQFARFDELRWLTEPPPLVQSWSPILLVLLVVRRAWGEWRRWQHTLFLACISLIVADQFRESLGDLCGRYWPETWHHNNPSLIGTGAYGFHPFTVGDDTGSFPSGHAARIAAFAAVFWLSLPRGRWLYAALAAPMFMALVAMNYHFVSDVIAGGVLGGIIGVFAATLGGLRLTAP